MDTDDRLDDEQSTGLSLVADNAEVDVDFDERNPRALINIVPVFVREQMRYLQTRYFEMAEDVLEALAKPTELELNLKHNFWEEYDRAQRHDQQMRLGNMLEGVGTRFWFKKWVGQKAKLAWLVRVPASYDTVLASIHKISLRHMKQIMEMPNVDGEGKPNTKLMDVKFKIAQHVDTRLKGAFVQRIDQRSMNVNVNATAPATNTEKAPEKIALTMVEIEAQLEALRKRSKSLQSPGSIRVDLLSDITAQLKDSQTDQPEVIEADIIEVDEAAAENAQASGRISA